MSALADTLASHSIPEPNSGCLLWTGPALSEMASVLGSALRMLEVIASKMPAGADLRIAIEDECAAMRSACRAILAHAKAEGR